MHAHRAPLLLTLLLAATPALGGGPEPILLDGLEPGSPSSWSSAPGWSCVDGDAPVTGNSTTEEPGTGGCPDGMVAVSTFCIDVFEASLERLDGPGGPWSPYLNPGATPVRARSVRGATPQGYISQVTADAACQASGKRLCSNDEWLRACKGPSATTYPWGNSPDPGRCNDHRDAHPLVEYYGTTEPWIWDHIDQPCLNQLPASLERAGNRPGCVSAEGPHDMMGNLQEWTDFFDGTARGGFYVDTTINGPGCNFVTTAHDTNHFDYTFGFRCCADP